MVVAKRKTRNLYVDPLLWAEVDAVAREVGLNGKEKWKYINLALLRAVALPIEQVGKAINEEVDRAELKIGTSWEELIAAARVSRRAVPKFDEVLDEPKAKAGKARGGRLAGSLNRQSR